MIVLIGDKIITNDLHIVTEVPVDFPEAPLLSFSQNPGNRKKTSLPRVLPLIMEV